MRSFAVEKGVSIERIVREEVLSALRANGKFVVDDAATSGSSTLAIKVQMYGFSIPHGLSAELVSMLSLSCTIVDNSGRVIWSAKDYVLPLGNPVPPIPAGDLLSDPTRIEAAWRGAARKLATGLAANL